MCWFFLKQKCGLLSCTHPNITYPWYSIHIHLHILKCIVRLTYIILGWRGQPSSGRRETCQWRTRGHREGPISSSPCKQIKVTLKWCLSVMWTNHVLLGNCGASVSKQYIAASNCYIAKVYQCSKCQVAAHRLWHVAKQGLQYNVCKRELFKWRNVNRRHFTSLMASIMMGAMMGTRMLERTRRALARMSWLGSLRPFWNVEMERRATSCCSSA